MAALSIALAFSKPTQSTNLLFSSPPKHPPHRSTLRFSLPPSSTPTLTQTESPKPTTTYSFLEESFRTGKFLTNTDLEKLKSLESFAYFIELESGSLMVRVMRSEEMDSTVNLLAESFGESMLLPKGYQSVLKFLVKQYLIERREVLPYAVTLVGFYKKRDDDGDDDKAEMAGTVEVCLEKKGANASPPTPTPPKDSPYVCNMTVKENLRRRGIGWHLLKASEELITQLGSLSTDVFLHCRMVDEAPFNMYKKAGYEVVKTDTVFVLLMLQRRKHLMCKKLPLSTSPSDTVDMVESDNELASSANL